MSQELLKAYHQALYVVFIESGEMVLKVGERNPALIDLLQRKQTENWAYLTAANPRSQLLSDEENQSRNQHLESILEKQKYLYFKGEGRSAQGNWPSEKSFLVLGISEKEAIHLARQFNQAGLLIGTSSGVPVLRILE